MEALRQWIGDTYTPVVLVAATLVADEIVSSKNGLSVVDLLRPFSHVARLDAQVRVGDDVIKVPDLQLRLHDIRTLTPPKPEALEQHLHAVLQAAAHKHASLEPYPEVLRAALAGTGPPSVSLPDLAPWFGEYASEFLRVTGWGEHHMIDHPVAALLVAPADVPNVEQHFEAVLKLAHVPPMMQQEVMYPLRDREFPRHYVLLHDTSSPMASERKVQENLAVLQRAYGAASVSLVTVNSSNGEREGQGAGPELFRRHMAPCVSPGGGAGEPESRLAPPPQGLGACLSTSDLESVAACLRRLVSQMLLPRLEERVAKLNATVTAARRGLRNRITRLWKGVAEDVGVDKSYVWHSVESQMRQLADLAFLLGAHNFANEMYRLAGQDYQAAGNHRWYAGVEEMRALAIIMAPNDSDPQKYFVRAHDAYGKLPGRPGRLLATRAAIMCARFQQAAGRYLAASIMLMRPHQEEESARAAVLLEQSALCLLYTSPPSVRKFAFHMVLAGLRYNAAGLKRLGLHAYRQVLGVYQGRHWRAIEEHLHDVMGRLSREAGDDQAACRHLLALLQEGGGTARGPAAQAHYLAQFLEVVVKCRPKDALPGQAPSLPTLRLPSMTVRDIKVLFADSSCFGNALAAASPASVWAPLEVACSGDATVMRDVATAALKQQNAEHEEYNLMAAGEAVGVTLRLHNRLGVKLQATQIRLVCEFTPLDKGQGPLAQPLASMHSWQQRRVSDADEGGGSGGGGGGGAAQLPVPLDPLGGGGAPAPAWRQQSSEYLHQQALRLSLHPGEAISEVLSVTPLAAGWLRIKGVAWLLNDAVEGFAPFEPGGRRRKHPKGPRLSQQKHFAPSRRLLLRVVPAMCRLQLAHDTMPSSMHMGEVRRVVLRICNSGSLACRNLQLAISHPEVVCSGCTPATAATSPTVAETCAIQPVPLPPSQQVPGLSVYRPLSADQELAPSACLDWTLWLHPRGAGNLQVHMVWYCEPVGPAGSLPGATFKFRALRTSHTLSVTPALLACTHFSSLVPDLAAQLLRLDLDVPQQGVEAVQVLQLSALTGGRNCGWRLSTDMPRAQQRASASPDGGTDHDVHMLLPDLELVPGHPSSLQLILQPPPPPQPPGNPQTLTAAEAATKAARPPVPPPVQLDCSGAIPAGLLTHFYLTPSPDGKGKALRGSGGGSAALASQPGSLAALRGSPASGDTAVGGGGGVALPVSTSLHSDPPVDLAITWRLPQRESHVLGAGGDTLASHPGPAPARVGLLLLPDLAGCTHPPLQPLRSHLRVQGAAGGGGGSGVVMHDFRASSMCLVDLVLSTRNCSALPVQVEVQVGEDQPARALQHAWQVPSSSSPGALPTPSSPAPSAPLAGPAQAGGAAGGMSRVSSNLGLAGIGAGAVAMGPLERGSVSLVPRDSISSAGGASLSSLSLPAGLPPGADYIWCGRTKATIPHVEPGASTEVALRVAFFRPGTYAVSGCRLRVAPAASLAGPVRTALARAVTVQQQPEGVMVRVDSA